MNEKPVIVYTDGSGKGWICAMFDYGEGYQRCYFENIDDRIFHEYLAMKFAVGLMIFGYRYILYNDNYGAIQHVNRHAPPPTDIIRHLVKEIREAAKGLDVTFAWTGRETSLAGIALDTGARAVYAPKEWLKGADDDARATWSPGPSQEYLQGKETRGPWVPPGGPPKPPIPPKSAEPVSKYDEERGSSSNIAATRSTKKTLDSKLQNPNRYAFWPPEKEDRGSSNNG